MELKYRPSFFRDISAIKEKDKKLMRAIEKTILQLQKANNIYEIPGLKKLKQYKVHYRIKIKLDTKTTYRLGLMIRGNTVWLIRFRHRDKIYKLFP